MGQRSLEYSCYLVLLPHYSKTLKTLGNGNLLFQTSFLAIVSIALRHCGRGIGLWGKYGTEMIQIQSSPVEIKMNPGDKRETGKGWFLPVGRGGGVRFMN